MKATAVVPTKEGPSAQVNRVLYLQRLWEALKREFKLDPLPDHVAITCGWPSRGARGVPFKRKLAEIEMRSWRGTGVEEAFTSVHPQQFRSPEDVSLALLFSMAMKVWGRKQGPTQVGLTRDAEGHVVYAGDAGAATKAVIMHTLRGLGALPEGFADVPYNPRPRVEKTRLLKFVCDVCGDIARHPATDRAGGPWKGVHSHGRGRPQGTYAIPTASAQAA